VGLIFLSDLVGLGNCEDNSIEADPLVPDDAWELVRPWPRAMLRALAKKDCSMRTALLLCSAVVFHCSAMTAVEPPKPHGPVPSSRQLKWHELELYAFAHFTVDTFNDVEWGFGNEKESDFNPTAFDADQIVRAVAEGGLKGLIITAKHHDGFCLWPSKYTEHSVKNSPWKDGKGDVLRELSDACKKHGIKFGVYLSPWDRHHPDYGGPGYVAYYHNQIREIATNYGPLFEMWFDGACGGDGYYGGKGGVRQIDYNTYYGWMEIHSIIRGLQPECAIWCGQYTEQNRTIWADARWGGSEAGTVEDPCWSMMDGGGGNAWGSGVRGGDSWCGAEGDVSIRPGWFYHAAQDAQVKSPEELMGIYLSCVGRGANLILNLPPDRRGQLHDNDVTSLAQFGAHLRETFAVNLAQGGNFEASNVRGGDKASYGPQKLLDADRWSAWVTDDDVKTPEVIVNLDGVKTFNLIRLREDIRLGQRVDEAAVDAWVNGSWREIAKAQSIGACRLWRVPPIVTDRVRLRVVKAAACPALSDFGLFLEPPPPQQTARTEARDKLVDRVIGKTAGLSDNPGVSPDRAIKGHPDTFSRPAAYTATSGIPTSKVFGLAEQKRLAGATYLPVTTLVGAAPSWPDEKIDTWHGFKRHVFTVDGCQAWIVEPKQPAAGNPWTWFMEFPDAFTERTGVLQLLEKGFYHAHISVGNTFGCPAAVKQFDAFYRAFSGQGLASKGTLIGISRGGLYAYNWAAKNPDKVVCIYGDAPVCDFKSWPGGKGKGKGSPSDWATLIEDYGFANEAEALAYKQNPIDELAPLAKAGIPLIHVVGDTDDVVPVVENTTIVARSYEALGGKMVVIHKAGVGHHPHGLDDPTPLVKFILEHTTKALNEAPDCKTPPQ
jgi:alpha-L-fucosidase